MKIRFRLRSLLLIVGLFALACWAYWIGWPWWNSHQQKMRFVDAVLQLQNGIPRYTAEKLVTFEVKHAVWIGGGIDKATEGRLISHIWPDAIYCCYLVCTAEDLHGNPPSRVLRIELYRLPPVPSQYLSVALPDATLNYQFDFLSFLNSNRAGNLGFKYEKLFDSADSAVSPVIHADTPIAGK
jgi:hypothetical protein